MGRYNLSMNTFDPPAELYFSVDIEATGPIPGPYSMSSFGATLAAVRMKSGEIVRPATEATFYSKLAPLEGSGYDDQAIMVEVRPGYSADPDTPEARFEAMKLDGEAPQHAMTRFSSWIEEVKSAHGGARAIFAAYPLMFDWLFVRWYFGFFGVHNPFGFSGCLDMKSYYSAKFNAPVGRSTKRHMPKRLLKSDAPHSHHPLDDARGQGDLLFNLLTE